MKKCEELKRYDSTVFTATYNIRLITKPKTLKYNLFYSCHQVLSLDLVLK